MIWEIKSPADSIHFVGHFTCIQIVVFVHIFSILSFDFIQSRQRAFYLTANHEESKQEEGIENVKNCENLIFCQFHYLFFPNIDKKQADTIICCFAIFCRKCRKHILHLWKVWRIQYSSKSLCLCSKKVNNNGETKVVSWLSKIQKHIYLVIGQKQFW